MNDAISNASLCTECISVGTMTNDTTPTSTISQAIVPVNSITSQVIATILSANGSNAINAADNQIRTGSKCTECKTKDILIDLKLAQIKKLRKRLQKVQQKNWYMEKTKRKLSSAFSKMKEERLLNAELCKVIEVLYEKKL